MKYANVKFCTKFGIRLRDFVRDNYTEGKIAHSINPNLS